MNTERKDVYSRITSQIVASLEQGVRPWIKPWNAEHAAERITRPLRHNGQPYSGINVLALWASAMVQNFAAPIWVTYRQAQSWARRSVREKKDLWSCTPTASPAPSTTTRPARTTSAKSRT